MPATAIQQSTKPTTEVVDGFGNSKSVPGKKEERLAGFTPSGKEQLSVSLSPG
tara:strand:- start:23 stop:181 length:159 start_codon:yes stop_codon:yes gene_type:complete